MMRRVLSVYLPSWPIDLARRRRRRGQGGSAGPEAALILAVASHGREVVQGCCHRAAARGVRAGMTLAHARALLPEGACVESYRPARDAAALLALAQWAIRFSPRVAPDGVDGLLLDATGLERLFGGERNLLNRMGEALARLGFTARLAAAPSVGAAWALARFAQAARTMVAPERVASALRPLPVAALRLKSAVGTALAEMGVLRVEQVLALPRPALARRFGPELSLRLDQALGQAWEGFDPLEADEPVRVERVFAGPVKKLEAVMLAARGLLEALAQRLAARQAGLRRLEVELTRLDADPTLLTVALSRPSRDARHLWALLSVRLERANLGYGVERLSLTAAQMGRLRHEQLAYLRDGGGAGDGAGPGAAAMPRALGELLDVMVNRLGPRRVTRAHLEASHIPERAFRCDEALQPQPPVQAGARAGRDRPELFAGPGGDRPSALFEPPEPAQVTTVTPDGPVLQLRWRGRQRRIAACLGPERIAPQWWAVLGGAPADEHARDYFRAQDETGLWLWLYRQGRTGRWFVHGAWR